MTTYNDLAPFIKRLLGAPNEATARRIMGAIGIGASSDSIVEGINNLFFTQERVEDAMAVIFAVSTLTGISIVYDDALNKFVITVAAGAAGITRSVASIAVNTAASAAPSTDFVYVATAGAVVLTLPTAVGNTNRYTYKNGAAANVTAASTGGQTFDGSASPITLVPNQSLDFVSDGANWRIE